MFELCSIDVVPNNFEKITDGGSKFSRVQIKRLFAYGRCFMRYCEINKKETTPK